MLSHHELATLMRLQDTPRSVAERDPDVLALRRYQLVEIREQGREGATLTLTRRGRALLARLHPDAGRPPFAERNEAAVRSRAPDVGLQ
jgi:hypothetical protein